MLVIPTQIPIVSSLVGFTEDPVTLDPLLNGELQPVFLVRRRNVNISDGGCTVVPMPDE